MKFVVMNYAFKMVETTFFTASSMPRGGDDRASRDRAGSARAGPRHHRHRDRLI